MKQFQAESKRLMDLMVNSIYTNKEIFLRELISNASDAIDKLYFLSLTDDTVQTAKDDYEIRITPNAENGTLTITDNGIGMSKEDLESNLGVIASSGSLKFREEMQSADDIDIIGQFGVGFYSAFMVASKVTVISRAFGEDTAWQWQSQGAEGYTITEAARQQVGTDIILVLKEDDEEEVYSNYLDQMQLQQLIKKYSDYIRYPIRMMVTEHRPIEDSEEYETEEVTELQTLNSMVPLWRRGRDEVTDDEFAAFYQEKFLDFMPPARVMQSRTEGTATYNALMFIPSHPPYDYYTKEYEKGLQLYASGVLIMDKCADLLPDHFSFVKGLVDSQDLSLNISREMLQQDRQLRLMRGSLERKIRTELTAWLRSDREEYETFFENFGLQLKVGTYADYGTEADNLKDLLLFYSANKQKLVTLEEYIEAMPEEQEYIYYAAGSGDTPERLAKLPQAEMVLDKGFDVLLFTQEVDEFAVGALRTYEEKEFRNISGEDLGLESDDEKEAIEKQNKEHEALFELMKETLDDKITDVKASGRLKNHPVIITSTGDISLEMEKVINQLPTDEKITSQKVLEINTEHPVFEKLTALFDDDQDKLKDYTRLLYDQALLIEGLPLDDPVAYSNLVCTLLAE